MRSFSRMSLEERWGLVEFENLKGTWQLKEPRAAGARQPTAMMVLKQQLMQSDGARSELQKELEWVSTR